MNHLRVARLDDLAQIVRLEREIFGSNAWSEAAVAAEGLAAGSLAAVSATRSVFVSTADEVVVGYAMLLCAGEVADILRIAVRHDHRREGRASALLEALLDIARSQNCRRMLLEVAADNSAALTFYGSRGFAEIDRRRSYYADGVDALVLQKPL